MRYTIIINDYERDAEPFVVVRDEIMELFTTVHFEVESIAERFVP